MAFSQSVLSALVPRQAQRAAHADGSPTDTVSEDFELPADAAAVASARALVRERATCWGCSAEVGHVAQLIVSEFFTNAVLHTDSSRVLCHLRLRGDRLRIEVADEGSERVTPRLREPGENDLGGRGLQLVGAVADEWGVVAGGGRGRVVWAELDSAGE